MEEVLDIENIIGERGFLPSSSDDEEEAAQFSKVKASLSSRLATIFAEDQLSNTGASSSQSSAAEASKSPSPSSSTIFCSVVNLYICEDGGFAFKGRAGVAVVRNSTVDLLVFYNANKETILLVPLGPGKINRIKKNQQFILMESSSKTFTVVCINSDDELKLIALLMILCVIDSSDLEAGCDDEVQMGSSVLYEGTPFVFDGSAITSCSEEQSKLRLSTKAEPWAIHMLGMRKSAKRLIRKDERTVVLIYVKRVKHSMKKQDGSLSTSFTSAPEGVAHDENDVEGENNTTEQQLPDNENLRKRVSSTGFPVLPVPSHSDKSSLYKTTYAPQPDQSEPFEPGPSTSHEQNEQSQSNLAAAQTFKEQEQTGTWGLSLDGVLTIQRIIGVEVDRLEIRLEAALERMVDRHMSTIRNELREIRERQETLLRKFEELRQ